MDIRNFFSQNSSTGNTSNNLRPIISNDRVSLKRPNNSQPDYDQKYDKKRCRKVLSSWLETYNWLKTNENNSVMWCDICRKHPKNADQTSNFFKEPGLSGDALRLPALKAHASSRKHKDCVLAELAAKNPNATPLAKCIVRLSEDQLRIMHILFNTAYHCVKQELAFTKFSAILSLQEKNGLSFGNNYRNDKQAQHFANHIAMVEVNKLKAELSKARFFTVMADGSTDVTVKEEEIIYVRFIQEGMPNTNFVSLVEAESGDAKGILNAINKGLETIGESCSSSKLVCMNLDGAAVNMGSKAGVGALVKKDIPYLSVIHCVAHKFELAISDSIKLCSYINGKFDETIKGILKIYQYSPKLRRQLKEVASFLDTVPAQFGMVQQIRWLVSQQRALQAVEKNWSLIVIHLEDVANGTSDQAARAKGYLKEIKSNKFLHHLYQMIDILDILTPLSKEFQSDNTLIVDLTSHIETVLLKLLELQQSPGPNYTVFKTLHINNKYKGVDLTSTQIDYEPDLTKLVKHVSNCISNRFACLQQKPISLFEIFDFTLWPLQKKELAIFGSKEIKEICDNYASVLTANEIENIKKEWSQFKLTVTNLKKGSSSKIEVYSYLLRTPPEDLKNILILIELMFCFSPSTAACERGFSTMNRLKTATRNALSNTSMNTLMCISIDGVSEEDFNPEAAIHHWLTSTKGTRHLAGHSLAVDSRINDDDSDQ